MQKRKATLELLGFLALTGALMATGCDDGTDGGGDAGAGGDDASGGGTGEGGESSGGSSSGGASSGGASSGGSGAGDGAADDCTGLCEGAGYDSADEFLFEDFPGGECSCAGDGDDLTQESCNAYCDTFDIPPMYSYLSSVNDDGAQDKCVCDGSAL